MDMKLELIVVPVSDIDQAKAFYATDMGFKVEVDHRAGDDFRVVQLTPPGSACSIALMRNDAAGSLHGLHLTVSDIEAAHRELSGRGVPAGEMWHMDGPTQTPGPDPERRSYNTFFSVDDPDGNTWLVQEVHRGES